MVRVSFSKIATCHQYCSYCCYNDHFLYYYHYELIFGSLVGCDIEFYGIWTIVDYSMLKHIYILDIYEL